MKHAIMMPNQQVIVVVEDDYLLRLATSETFRNAGFYVFDAQNSAHALAILAMTACNVHAIFTDVHMPPGISGLSLVPSRA